MEAQIGLSLSGTADVALVSIKSMNVGQGAKETKLAWELKKKINWPTKQVSLILPSLPVKHLHLFLLYWPLHCSPALPCSMAASVAEQETHHFLFN